MAMLLIVSGTVWVFVSVAVFAALDVSSGWWPKANVAGVSVVCANANPPGTRRKSKRTVQPKNRAVPYFAVVKRELK
jgi:hypothetical protein